MPGRCPKCGSRILKRTSRNGYTFYACEKGADCGFMTWNVPVKENCPKCGKTMFKLSGKGRNKPFCINEECEDFLPEDQRGYKKKAKPAEENAEQPAAEETAEKPAETEKPAAKRKTAASAAAAKKPAAKKRTAKKAEE